MHEMKQAPTIPSEFFLTSHIRPCPCRVCICPCVCLRVCNCTDCDCVCERVYSASILLCEHLPQSRNYTALTNSRWLRSDTFGGAPHDEVQDLYCCRTHS